MGDLILSGAGLGKEDVDIVSDQDEQTLAEWYRLLNTWKWPDALPNPPENDGPGNRPYGKTRRSYLMEYITARIGEMAISYWWNRDRMTLEEHQEWFKARFIKS